MKLFKLYNSNRVSVYKIVFASVDDAEESAASSVSSVKIFGK